MTAAIGVRPCSPVGDFEHEGWTRLVRYKKLGTLSMRVGLEGRHWHFLNPGMSACIVLRVAWLPTLRSFQVTFGIAEARPCSQSGLWLIKWILAAAFQTAIICRSQ
eukprot:597519-Pelagomonas_calceolata.AAC.1